MPNNYANDILNNLHSDGAILPPETQSNLEGKPKVTLLTSSGILINN